MGATLQKKNAKTDDQKTWLPMDSTIILGCNPKDEKDECMVEWNFDVSQLLKKNLVAAHLKITTFRTTGGLHINPVDMLANGPNKQGRLFLNDKMVDNIDLIKAMPCGTDYGFNRLDAYPILSFIRQMKKKGETVLKVKLEVDKKVCWDIDEISLESLTYKTTELNKWVWMFIGAILSSGLGVIVKLLETRF
jgi:hypothetical protein